MNLRLVVSAAALLLCGCQTLSSWAPSWFPSIPTPSFAWLGFGHSSKPGPMPTLDAKASAHVNWQVPLGGKGGASFAPAVRANVVYAAGPDGTIVSVDPAGGKPNWRVKADKPLTAGVGADQDVVIVGTAKGEVLAFDAAGKALWQAKISSEVAGPPAAAEGKIIVWSLDGKIFALNAADGSQKWV
ncbi:MAG: outer membrane protein assembly factor BamB, partial [Betaproteobacteria bacterium]